MSIVIKFHRWFIKRESKKLADRIAKEIMYTNRPFLEIGSGEGWLSNELIAKGFKVHVTDFETTNLNTIIADAHDLSQFKDNSFRLTICSNVLEHLHSPHRALKEMARVSQYVWLTWTPWYSPFGGHSFAPLHYFGVKRGGGFELGKNLYITTVENTLKILKKNGLEVLIIRPRYWPLLSFLAKWRWTREWATWNVEIVYRKKLE